MIVCIQLKITWKTSQPWCVSVSLWLMSVFMSRVCLTGQAAELEFPEAVQSCSTHQAAEAGLHHPHPAVDLCSVLQGAHTHYHTLDHMSLFTFTHPHTVTACTHKLQYPSWNNSKRVLLIHCVVVSSCDFQALPYVCLLIAMLFFIYAIIGMQVSDVSSLWLQRPWYQ